VRPFNEGKACDAVIRRIEMLMHASRTNVRFPEREGHSAPVELTCNIGDRLFAFEHTGIEPFQGHIRLMKDMWSFSQPIEYRLAGKLPTTEVFELHVPLQSIQQVPGRGLRRIQDALVDWIAKEAPALPVAPYGRYVTPIQLVAVPGVPFKVSLHRMSAHSLQGKLSIRILLDDRLEIERLDRIRAGYQKKVGKLAAWKAKGVRTVLILESSDIQLTNAQRVADALAEIEQSYIDKPDEVYLIDSEIPSSWWLWVMRIGARGYYELSQAGECLTEITPDTLDDLTKR
jgi:hypothetical protein